IVNLSSAAQAPVDLEALKGGKRPSDGAAYAQSKLALTMLSRSLADELGEDGPVVVAVNPGSLLGTKMVKAAFGTSGNDIGIGVDILSRAATSDEFADASGRYYDNDGRRFAFPHADAQDADKREALMRTINGLV
ncbi:MAG: SDR family NAD(P)-dependent oxidoreductase, partial [Aurantimonas coralicida]